jgi:HSP20 family molecular chaperone IbpA
MNMDNRSIPVAVGRSKGENGPEIAPRTDEEHREARGYQTPLIDIHEGPDGLILEADLPGATENNLHIELEDNVLSLHARLAAPAPEGARVLYEEYRVGDYYRSFILSDEVERSKITAELKNGVLRLVLPKAERAKTRRIEVKS